ncbi:hybrid sensor histidine kinase/response regulator [Chitinophaga solisilvae]|uniref:ATP-binding response regulator n=1 Tax=Chitinophaga solisilvae TaxID=1233460 RepID=UPI00136C6A03|nr:response regulator [Chitinophaga solisilvae]
MQIQALPTRIVSFFHRITYAGTEGIDNPSDRQSVVIINIFSLFSSITVLSIGAYFLTITQAPRFTIPMLIEGFTFLSVIWFNKNRKYTTANLLLFSIHSVAAFYWPVTLGDAMPFEIIYAFLFILLICGSCFIYRKNKTRIICLCITVTLLILLQVNFYFKLITPMPIAPQSTYIMRWSTTIAMLCLIAMIMFGYIRRIDKLIAELNSSNNTLNNILLNKETFLQETYHELRTPLNGIYGIAQLMLSERADFKSAEKTEWVDDLFQAADTARNIVNNVLDHSKLEAGKLDTISLEPTILNEVLKQATSLVSYLAGYQKLEIKLTVDDRVPFQIMTDKLMLTKILNNLLSNAVKFGIPGGLIELRTHLHQQKIFFYIRNQGLIGKDKLANIFEPFVAERHARFEGTGIGLYITKALVELLGGKIKVENTEHEFTTEFSFYIPLQLPPQTEVPAGQLSAPSANYQGLKVVVIDDDSLSLKVLKSQLSRLGVTPILTKDGESALEIMKTEIPAAVISDIHTGKMGGREVCEYMRGLDEYKHIPIIIISGDAFKETYDELMEMGANEFITKPFSFKQLDTALSKYLSPVT